MNLKQYKNELIVLFTFLLMIGAFFYKQHNIKNATDNSKKTEQSLANIKELIDLKSTWSDKQITKKVDRLKRVVSSHKVTFKRDGKKATIYFKNLQPKELDRVVNKILNLAVVIKQLEIKKSGTTYSVEFKCKW